MPTPSNPPSQVGDFSVYMDEQLGHGTFGAVYKAMDNTNRTVAAKKLFTQDETAAAMREYQNSLKLKNHTHENIIKIFEVLSEPGFWIFMEYCELGDLTKYYRTHFATAKELKTRLNIMIQVASGIEFLHKIRIAHRDIKPGNILLTCKGTSKTLTVKLTDFGLIRFIDPDAGTSLMSTNVGTMPFKAPEFWKMNPAGEIQYHRNIDVFATGLTFLAMLQANGTRRLDPQIDNVSDRQPQLSIGMIMLMRNQNNQPEPRVVEDRDGDEERIKGLKSMIRNMINFDPSRRPMISQVVEDLKKVMLLTILKSNIVKFRTNYVGEECMSMNLWSYIIRKIKSKILDLLPTVVHIGHG